MGLIITASVLVAFLLLFTKLKDALAKDHARPPQVTALGLFALAGVGIWLGFIVLDGATYLLLVLILLFRFDLPHANALKVLLLDPSVEALRAAYRFRDLQDFLDLYYQGTSVLLVERDFYELTAAYLARAAAQNIVHAELFFDPQAHLLRGVPFAAIIGGIARALRDGEADRGITSRLILCFLRDRSAAEAEATLDAALPFRDAIAGIGLDSAERGNPPGKFRTVFARAGAPGFP